MLLVTWFIRNHLPSSPEATTSVPTPMAVNRATTPNKINETVKTFPPASGGGPASTPSVLSASTVA
jgi:hypothetical protein